MVFAICAVLAVVLCSDVLELVLARRSAARKSRPRALVIGR
jgi:hypothetical protein